MTRTEAEQQYRDAYAQLLAAMDRHRETHDAVYRTRGIELPYVGPMKNKMHHADKRLAEIQREVHTTHYGSRP